MVERKERADAARNRRAILDAAETLISRHGATHVSIDQIAAAAGVGKGTVFHRFGSREGLLRELLFERAFSLRDAVAAGPPPLGPGAPAPERLRAYFDAMTKLVVDNVGIVVAYDQATTNRAREELHSFWYAHIGGLLKTVRPDMDSDAVAHVLLSMLSGSVVQEMVRAGQADRLHTAVHSVIESVVAGAP